MFKLNDRVVFDPTWHKAFKFPGVWIVTKILKVNVEVKREDGIGKTVRTNPELLQLVTSETVATAPTAIITEFLPTLCMGQLVKVNGPASMWKRPADELFMVVQDKVDTVKIVRVGGDKGKYWPSIPRKWLTPIFSFTVLIEE